MTGWKICEKIILLRLTFTTGIVLTRLISLALVYLNLAVLPLVARLAVAGVAGHAVLAAGLVLTGISLAVVNVVAAVSAWEGNVRGRSHSQNN